MTHTWHIRDYRDGDEEQILDLRRRVFGDLDPVRLMPETWRWQFRDNPSGEALWALAQDHDRIVGQYAVIPTRFSVQGNETRFALSCDTMIDPGYRRQGLFIALARKTYQRLASERDITTVWGFPNEASLPGFTRHLDWRLLTVFPLRIIPLRPLTMLRMRLGLKKDPGNTPAGREGGADATVSANIAGLRVEPVTRFDKEYDDLWNRRKNPAPVIQIRDAAYLNWRYADIPDFGYRPFAVRSGGRLLGYMVIRTLTLMGHFFGVLTDLFPFPIRDTLTTQQLFRFAGGYIKAEGGEFMTCLMSQADPAFLKDAGLRTVPAILNPRKWHLGARYADRDHAVLGSAHNWHLTYGDTDIV
ncbi:MAG: GNAT family N-acetyltransferase [Deltaproteobacteria bacterium]|nr:GNAT family N-acetyltransferase [Deltaproteobacteria bacterium]